MVSRGPRLLVTTVLVLTWPGLSVAAEEVHFPFDGTCTGDGGVAPVAAEGLTFVEGRTGQAVNVQRPAVLTLPTRGLSTDGFTISFRVRHDSALSSHFYQRLTYFYHETDDMRNRIAIVKRAGTNRLVFSLADGSGRAKGSPFAGDWFAMTSPDLAWEAASWHHIVCTVDRRQGVAQLVVDGEKLAEAHGTEMPDRFTDVCWIGTERGHSWMRGAMDDLTIEGTAQLRAGAVADARMPTPLPPAARVLGNTVRGLRGKELTINVDFFDICIGTDTWDMRHCEREMDRLMAMCAHYGIDRVFFRVSVCGAVCYHSRVMTQAREPSFAKYKIEGLDTCCANIPSRHGRLARVMAQIDPLAACAEFAHKHGMQVYAWVTIFDSMYYATSDEFFRAHPEYTWVSKDGSKHIPGVPCYAYPEVRAHRLAQMKELVSYDVDGLILSVRSHSPWPGRKSGGGNEGARGYGFNEPVVAEYVRRFGRDPKQAEPDSLAELRFVQLKADFLTQFLREVKGVTGAAGRKLVLNTSASISDPVRACWMYVDADTLVREQIIDELCLMSSSSADLNHWRLLGDGQVRVTTWASIHGKSYEECVPRMRSQFEAMLKNPTSDGSTFHELANLIYPDCWEETILDVLRGARGEAASPER